MEYCFQYHNYGNYGLPLNQNPDEWFGDGLMGIHTGRSFVQNEVGSQVFMIVGIGKNPTRYFLWDTFVIEDIQYDADRSRYHATGHGWMLNPPQLLEGPELDQFRHDCANFASFKRISHLPYTAHLKQLADTYHRLDWDADTLAFCNGLLEIIPTDEDAIELRDEVMTWLGEGDDSENVGNHEDWFDYAVQNQPPEDFELDSEDAAVSHAYQLIRLRRGQPEFRRQLMEAYEGKCAITGCDAPSALEAAHIIPFNGDATNDVRNGLLLRADIHTLFDLGMLHICPDTRKISLDDSLAETVYAELEGQVLREPAEGSQRPNRECLKHRSESKYFGLTGE